MRNKVKTGAQSSTESYAYTDDSDSPAWTSSGSTWTRYVGGPAGDVEAIQQSSGQVSYAISNLRGDIVAELTNGQLQAVREVDEFGVVKDGMPESRKYGFHGTKQREALTAGGTIAMGVRLYVPQTGRFLQVDPVLGGTEAPYVYPSDPVNGMDLDGRQRCFNRTDTYSRSGSGVTVIAHWCVNRKGKIINDQTSVSSYSFVKAGADTVIQGKGGNGIQYNSSDRKTRIYKGEYRFSDWCGWKIGCRRRNDLHSCGVSQRWIVQDPLHKHGVQKRSRVAKYHSSWLRQRRVGIDESRSTRPNCVYRVKRATEVGS